MENCQNVHITVLVFFKLALFDAYKSLEYNAERESSSQHKYNDYHFYFAARLLELICFNDFAGT